MTVMSHTGEKMKIVTHIIRLTKPIFSHLSMQGAAYVLTFVNVKKIWLNNKDKNILSISVT